MSRLRIGDILLEQGILTQVQLAGALDQQRKWGTALGRAAVMGGLCTDDHIMQALSIQLGLPIVNLDRDEPTPEVGGLIPQRIAEQLRAVALRFTGAGQKTLVVAMAAPARLDAQDTIRSVSQRPRLEVFLAGDEAIERAIGRVYRGERGGWSGPARGRAGERHIAPSEQPPFVELGALGLSASTLERLRRTAIGSGVTPMELVRRLLESWASRRPDQPEQPEQLHGGTARKPPILRSGRSTTRVEEP